MIGILYSGILKTPLRSLLIFALVSFTFLSKAQQANFDSASPNGCAPHTVQFNNTSSGINDATTFQWDLGNGNTSTEKNPAAIYATPGTYSVKLTITNGSTSTSVTKTGFVTVYAKPTPQFNFNPNTGCSPLTVNFTDTSLPGAGTITDWEWIFGNGESSQEKNPEYIYKTPGSFQVTLRVTNQFGCEATESNVDIINVTGPSASFTSSKETVCSSPAFIQFTNTTTETEPLTYEWVFGDGQTSTEKSPAHTFNTKGNYEVVLTVKNAANCSSSFRKVIQVGNEGGIDFTTKSIACPGEVLQLTPTFNGEVLKKKWDFGDGVKDSLTTAPTHQYFADGKYNITLTAKLFGKECESSITKTITIEKIPTVVFSAQVEACSRNVTFTNSSTASTTWKWKFGDGKGESTSKNPVYTYSSYGSFGVTLEAYSSAGCMNSITKLVVVPSPPSADFSPDKSEDCFEEDLAGCAPFTLNLFNKSYSPNSQIKNYKWTFGDGQTSSEVNPSHIYQNAGTYTLTLEVENLEGCKTSVSKNVIVSDVTPLADFSISNKIVCVNESITLLGELSTNADAFCWNLGNGSHSSEKNTAINYSVEGKYYITLTAKNGGCENTKLDSIEVKGPTAVIHAPPNCEDPYTLTFYNQSTTFESFIWNLDDGSTSTDMTITKTYTEGLHYVELKTFNSSTQCESTAKLNFYVQKVVAGFSLNEHEPCLNENLEFTNTSQAATSYRWIFDDGTADQTREIPVKSFNLPGKYHITLIATDSIGCTSEASHPVEVLNIVGELAFDPPQNECDYLRVNFRDESTSNLNIIDYFWDFGDNTTGTGKDVQHDYQEEGIYTVALTLITDQGKECSITRYDIINFQTPIPNFSTGKSGYCIGETVEIFNTSLNAISYEWHLPDGTTRSDFNTTMTFTEEGQYDITLIATDATGCSKPLLKKGYINITKPDASFEGRETVADCPPLISYFDNNSADAVSYFWSFGDGQHSTIENPANTYLRPGKFDVSLIVTDANNCKDTSAVAQIVQVGGPDGVITVEPLMVCVGEEVNFKATTTNTVMHRWDFGDGNVEEHEIPDAVHAYKNGTTAIVRATFIDANGCEVSAPSTYTVQTFENPEVTFTYSPVHPFENETISLVATSNGTELLWQIENDQTFNNDWFPKITFDSAGLKTIRLTATNQAGCSTDTVQQIKVQGNIIAYNIFTPGEDIYNPSFQFKKLEFGEWSLTVYNRWGITVFHQTHYDNKWKADDLLPGIYYYTITNLTRPDKTYKGIVTVVK